MNRIDGGRGGFDCRLTSRLAGDTGIFARGSCPFADFAEDLSLLTDSFKRLVVLIADLACVLGHSSKRFAFGACRFFGRTVDFSAHAAALRLLTVYFGLIRWDGGLFGHGTFD